MKAAMTIAIDASRALHPEPTGIELYSREIIRALLALPDSKNYDWRLLAPHLPPAGHDLASLPAHARWEIVPGHKFWTLYHLSKYFRRNETSLDLLFVPAHTLPLITPVRTVVTIHDFAFRYYPESYGVLKARQIDHEARRSTRKATHVIVPSHATAADLVKFYDTAQDHISIIPHGADHLPPPNHPRGERDNNPGATVPRPYFLFIGRIEPRKNVDTLLRAYARALNSDPDLPDLKLVGRPGYRGEEIMKSVELGTSDNTSEVLPPVTSDVKAKISFLGYQSQEGTARLLAGATAFVFPSRYEGFGIPVLEAMRAGVPVLTSTASSLPEVAGNAAILVDPDDTAAIADGLRQLGSNDKLRAELIKKGRERAKDFTWQRAAQATLKVFEDSLR